MLSVLILSAFAILGLIVLPALAEIRAKRRDEEQDSSEDDGSDDVLLAA
jgi:hypothetical protein